MSTRDKQKQQFGVQVGVAITTLVISVIAVVFPL